MFGLFGKSQLKPGWVKVLNEELKKPYIYDLEKFLYACEEQKKQIFPEKHNIFKAFNLASLEKIKVVILGQDPYHGYGQAHGLCFSVPKGVALPPSLVNIFKELESDLGISRASHGCLESWAKQGVFLLNSVLTVEAGRAGSHQGKGWEQFTDSVIRLLNSQQRGLVFLLWGAQAQKKAKLIDNKHHLILKAPHPSPLSVYRGFYGCKHFSKANEYLIATGRTAVEWGSHG